MKILAAIALLGVTMMGAAPAPPSPVSQSFADRTARITQRIENAAQTHALAAGEQQMLAAELDAAQRANGTQDPNAPAMLDVIDRQLAQADRTLSRANAGQALVVHTGDDVTVAMHDPYFYDVQISNTAALVLHRGVMWTRGVQGIYRATLPGTVTITLTPRAGTTPAAPASLQAPLVFTIVILPA